jgi:hypothetical protein
VACGVGYRQGSRECSQCADGYFPRGRACVRCFNSDGDATVAAVALPLVVAVCGVLAVAACIALPALRRSSPVPARAAVLCLVSGGAALLRGWLGWSWRSRGVSREGFS